MNWVVLSTEDQELLEFVRRAIALRKAHPAFRQPVFLHGSNATPDGVKDILWVNPRGAEQSWDDWHDPRAKCIGLQLNAPVRPPSGTPATNGDVVLVVMNAGESVVPFTLPQLPAAGKWQLLIDTMNATGEGSARSYPAGSGFDAQSRSLAVFTFVHDRPN